MSKPLPFKFKHFSIQQDRCAMKVGTDGVLLGAWASVEHQPENILDIGAGTGVIALMLAQRSAAENIEALEIDEDAFEQAVENFENSDWGDRLFCYHAAFDEFVEEMEGEKYELIVSNPPFYSDDYSSQDARRDQARFAEALPFAELLEGVARLLSEDGKFSLILPRVEEEQFLKLAESHSLFPSRITRVKGNPEVPEKRSLLELGFERQLVEPSVLVIETARHEYTPEYIALTRDFYLKM